MLNSFPLYYIGYSRNSEERRKASSGGIGSAIIRHLLLSREYGTSITFIFNKEKSMYEPKLIHSANDIYMCGSIYHDINIAKFVKENLERIKSGIVLTCPPCQVRVIRTLLEKNNINHFIISYCCSGQTQIEGTWAYYKLLGIKKEDVEHMQYRGNGWPSGIQIRLNNGKEIYHDNYTEPWVTMKSSRLYQPQRCFYCTLDTGHDADIALADPWLPEYKKNEKQGQTMFMINTVLGETVLSEMQKQKLICSIATNYGSYAVAQKNNIEKSLRVHGQERYLRRIIKLTNNEIYRKWATKSLYNMRIHIKICHLFKRFLGRV